VGDKVTAESIRDYIEYHHDEENSPKQLKFFYIPRLVGGVIHCRKHRD